MTDSTARYIREQPRFRGIFENSRKIKEEITLTLPATHDDESGYIEKLLRADASEKHVNRLEKEVAGYVGVRNAVALKSGMDTTHLAVKLATEKVYGSAEGGDCGKCLEYGALTGRNVFCSDFMPFEAVRAVIDKGGEPVFIDVSEEDWCMNPEVLELAFQKYCDVKIVMMNHTYGFPGQIEQVRNICREHDALLIEDISESVGAKIDGRQAGSFGDYGILAFGKDKMITSPPGGMILVNDYDSYKKVHSWVIHPDMANLGDKRGENSGGCKMVNGVAGMIRKQFWHLGESIAKKKAIYRRYLEKFDRDIISMNPIRQGTEPNFGVSCMLCDSNIQFEEMRTEWDCTYTDQHGTASPMEICDALAAFGVQNRFVYRPLSLYPMFQKYDQITLDGSRRSWMRGDNSVWVRSNISKGCFDRGVCLPSDIRMSEKEQDLVIDIVRACFSRMDLDRKDMLAFLEKWTDLDGDGIVSAESNEKMSN